MRTGILLVNLGTPDAPRTREVRRYLREFLSDPRVIDIAPIARSLLLNAAILPFRSPRSAEAYAQIWGPDGSPLLFHGRRLQAALAERLPDRPVELGMRYGNPSIASAMERLRAQGCARLVILPLYPQYAASSTGSTLERVYRIAGESWDPTHLAVVPPFFDDAGFLDAFAAVGAPVLADLAPEHVLFSFHGLPERHLRKSDPTTGAAGDPTTGAAGDPTTGAAGDPSTGHCLSRPDCCDDPGLALGTCYRAQCYATARGLAARLDLVAERWSVSFQSRLGRTVWIRPYTDEVLPELARGGVKRVAVFSPAFVADCLETLEEIGIRADKDFRAAGGDELRLVPSLNAEPLWVDAVLALVRRAL